MREKEPCVYILASAQRGTLYVGVTSDLVKRVFEHKTHAVPGFTFQYGVTRLVWFEAHDSMRSAICRETDQGLAPFVEAATDRAVESAVGRSVH